MDDLIDLGLQSEPTRPEGNDGGTRYRSGSFHVHRSVLYFSPKLLERFNRKKRQGTRKWNLETNIKVKGELLYLYRAMDSNGDTVSSVSAKTVISQQSNAFCTRLWPGMADRSELPLMAVRPIALPFCNVLLRTGLNRLANLLPFAPANI